jgi:MoxR-like ATPase
MAKNSNNINVQIFTQLKVSEVSRVPVFLIGAVGAGKTTSVYMFAQTRGYEVVLLRGNSETNETIIGYSVSPEGVSYDKPMAAVHLRPDWFQTILNNHAQGKKTLLLLDELNTANEFVQAALLHLVFERKVGNEDLPEDTMIVSAGNYSGNVSSTMSMMGPTLNRWCIINIVPEVSDLDSFLNKFDGCLINDEAKPNNYMENLKKVMKALDEQEQTDIDEVSYNKIGAYIERNILETTKMIMTTEKKHDPRVQELMNIYQETAENDKPLYNFITMRSLVYLREITVAYYICFGKAGIMSDNYKRAINGLVGYGTTRDKKSGEVQMNEVGNEYFNNMQLAINEIEKMKNSTLPKYEKFFTDIIKSEKTDVNGNKELKTSFTHEEINALINKFEELKRDKQIQNIERPIDPDVMMKICGIIRDTGKGLFPTRITSTADVTSIPLNELAGYVVDWNSIVESVNIIDSILRESRYGYSEEVTNNLNLIVKTLRSVGFKLRSVKKMVSGENKGADKLIPEIKSITSTES